MNEHNHRMDNADGPSCNAPTIRQRDWMLVAAALREITMKAVMHYRQGQYDYSLVDPSVIQELTNSAAMAFNLEMWSANMELFIKREHHDHEH